MAKRGNKKRPKESLSKRHSVERFASEFRTCFGGLCTDLYPERLEGCESGCLPEESRSEDMDSMFGPKYRGGETGGQRQCHCHQPMGIEGVESDP